MKCSACKGTGKSKYGYNQPCYHCEGTGIIEPLTNEEWFYGLSTEEKAKFLFGIAYMCSYCGDEAHSTKEKTQQCHFGKCCCQRQDWIKWLKQPHREKHNG